MATAFISHASQDREVALRICSFLEERGIQCWIAPRDVRPGRQYGEEIVAAIQNANAVILVLSENANTSTFVEREIERAVNYGKPTLPVRVREVQPSRSLELFISSAHWIDAWKPPMEQYLDRLADSIRSLSPDGAEKEEAKWIDTGKKKLGGKGRATLAKRIGIAVVALILLGATVAVFLSLGKQRKQISPAVVNATPTPTVEKPTELEKEGTPPRAIAEAKPELPLKTPRPPETPAPIKSPLPSSPPSRAPEVETAKPVEPAESSKVAPSVAQVLSALGATNGTARFAALKQNVERLPEQITVKDLLALTRNTDYRNEAIRLMVSRLPNPLSVQEMLQILGSTSDNERYALIRMLIERLSSKLTVDDLLALISSSSYRNEAIKAMVSRLPKPLSVEDMLRILGSTSDNERYALIRMLVERLPTKITVDNLLTLISSSSYRNEAIKAMVSRLPNPLSVEEMLQILGTTSDSERYALIRMLVERLPNKISVDNLLALISGSSYRNEAIKAMVSRLSNPLSVEDMLKILGLTSGNERYALIQIIAARAPAGLSSSQISALAQGSAYSEQAGKLLSR